MERVLVIKDKWLYFLNRNRDVLMAIGMCILGIAIGLRPIHFAVLLGGFVVLAFFFSNLELPLILFVIMIPFHCLLVLILNIIPGMWKEILLISIFILWFFKGILHNRLLITKTEINIPICLYIVYASFFLLVNISEFDTNILGLRNLVQYILVYFLAANIIRTKEGIKKYIFIIILVGVIVAVINDFLFLSKPGRINLLLGEQIYSSQLRYNPLAFMNANNYAYYLCVPTCLLFGLYLFASRRWKWLIGIGISILVASILLTYSRGAILAISAAILFWSIGKNRKLLVALIAILIIISFFLPPSVRTRFSPEHLAPESRLWHLFFHLRLIKDSPLLGVGLGRVGAVGEGRQAPYYYPHNYYLYVLLQTGMIGLAIYLWILVKLFRMCLNLYERLDGGYFKGLAAGIAIYYVMFAVSALFSAAGESFISAPHFWLISGLLVVLNKSFILDGGLYR